MSKHKEHVPEYGPFFTYIDENKRKVTVAGSAIVEVVENTVKDATAVAGAEIPEIHVNYGDGVPDLFTGETAEQFLQWWENFKTR